MGISVTVRNSVGQESEVEIPDPPPAEETPDSIITLLSSVQSGGADQTASYFGQLEEFADGTEANPRIITVRTSDRLPAVVDGRLRHRFRNHLFIEGDEFTFTTSKTGIQAGDVQSQDPTRSTRSHIWISGCNDVDVRNMSLLGPYTDRFEFAEPRYARWVPATGFEHLVLFDASTDCHVEDIYGSWFGGDGVCVTGPTEDGQPCENISTKRIVCDYPGRQNIALVSVDGYTDGDPEDPTAASVFNLGARSGLDVEPNGDEQYVTNVALYGTQLSARFNPVVMSGKEANDQLFTETGQTYRKSHILLDGTTGLDAGSSAYPIIVSRGGHDIRILNHTDLRNRSTRGATFTGVDGWELSGAQISTGRNTPVSIAVVATDCSGVQKLTDNEFLGIVLPQYPKEGFDELIQAAGTTVLADIERHGNRWRATNLLPLGSMSD